MRRASTMVGTIERRLLIKEEVVEPTNAPDPLPHDLTPATAFDETSIRAELPEAGPFRLADLRWFARRHQLLTRPNNNRASGRAVRIP
jgi:hypothetical protein